MVVILDKKENVIEMKRNFNNNSEKEKKLNFRKKRRKEKL